LSEFKWSKAFKYALATTALFFLMVYVIINVLVAVNYAHLGRLSKVMEIISKEYVEEVSLEKLVDGAIEGMVNLDPYSEFHTAEEHEWMMNHIEGEFGGIGIYYKTEQDRLVITEVIRGAPAEKEGLEAGDEILRVDGEDVAHLTQGETITKMRGPEGSQVTVDVFRGSTQEHFQQVLTRAIISVSSVEWAPYPGEEDMAVVYISTFNKRTFNDFDGVLKEIDAENRYKGVIIDLRNNPGGELNAGIAMTSRFVPQGPVMYTVDRRGAMQSMNRREGVEFLNRPFVLLVNENSASASEVLIGAVKDYETGSIVGTKTFGKGVIQSLFSLDEDTGIKLTVQKYLTPHKKDVHGVGIEPDYLVQLEKDEKITVLPEETPDSQMQKACEVLRGRI